MPAATPMQGFADAMASTEMDSTDRAVVVALAELSCSPGKFDLLWDLWPRRQFRRERFPDLAGRVLRKDLGNLLACSAVAFDDLTIFADIVGDPDIVRSERREAYRVAYLTIRPMVFRVQPDSLPRLPHTVTQAEYMHRLISIAATLRPALLEDVVEVLSEAALRYEDRDKTEGSVLCRQNADLLVELQKAGLAQSGPGPLGQQSMAFLFSVEHAALFNEIVIQCWPLFDARFRQSLRPSDAADVDASEGIRDLCRSILRLSPFAWLNDSYPGSSSVLLSLSYARLVSGLQRPYSLTFLPSDLLAGCLQCVETLRREWRGEPSFPVAEADGLMDVLVAAGHAARQRSFGARRGAPEAASGLADAAMLQLDITAKAARRARNELSEDTYALELCNLVDAVHEHPVVIDLLLHHAAMTHRQQPALADAVLEAARIMAPFTKNPSIIDAVMGARTRRPEDDVQAAERFSGIGRPDLAIMALHNAGVSLLNAGDCEGALKPLGSAWERLDRIRSGVLRVPESTVFDLNGMTQRVAGVRVRVLAQLGRHEECLEVIERALAAATDERSNGSPMGPEESVTDLQLLASDVLDRLGRREESLTAAEGARERAMRLGLDDIAGLAYLKLATFAYREGRSQERLKCLIKAQRHADRHRRSFPFEMEKIQAFEPLQLAYAWAGEALIEEDKPWEALSAFEGLRSRALLDLLGFSGRIAMPQSIGAELATRGDQLLQKLRSIALPGGGDPFYAIRDQWLQLVRSFDEWLERVSAVDRQYAAIVGGRAMTPDDIRHWAASTQRATAVVFWFLGEAYSYQAVLQAVPGTSAIPPEFRKVNLRIAEVRKAAQIWQRLVRSRSDPPSTLLEDLSERLLGPVADLLLRAEVVYVCPSQELNALPIGSLRLHGKPLNTVAEVATVPTLSVLRALQTLKRSSRAQGQSVVYGPYFPALTDPVSGLLGTTAEPVLFSPDTREPSERVRNSRLLHLACHGYHDSQ